MQRRSYEVASAPTRPTQKPARKEAATDSLALYLATSDPEPPSELTMYLVRHAEAGIVVDILHAYSPAVIGVWQALLQRRL